MEDGVEGGEMGEEDVADVLGELGEHKEGALLEARGIGGDALEHEGEKLGPLTLRDDARSELGDGVAELLHDCFGFLAVEAGEEDGLDGGLGGGGEGGPDEGVIAGDLLSEKDGGHGAELGLRRRLEEVGELQGEGVGLR